MAEKVAKPLTQWGRVTHICVSNLTIIGSDNGLSHGRCLAIIWTNAGILLIEPLGTNLSAISIVVCILENAFENVVCDMAAILSRPQCVYYVVLAWEHIFLLEEDLGVAIVIRDLLTTDRPYCRYLSIHSIIDTSKRFWSRHFQTHFSKRKYILFLFKFHWRLFVGVKLKISQHW